MPILLVITIICALITLGVHIWTGVPPFPSLRHEHHGIDTVLAHVHEQPKHIVELGCGWGNMLFYLARRYPQAQVHGIEWSPLPYLVTCIRSWWYPNVSVQCWNFFRSDLSNADLVTAYLMRGPMDRLEKKLEAELKDGAHVVTLAFALPTWKPVVTQDVSGVFPACVCLYRKSP